MLRRVTGLLGVLAITGCALQVGDTDSRASEPDAPSSASAGSRWDPCHASNKAQFADDWVVAPVACVAETVDRGDPPPDDDGRSSDVVLPGDQPATRLCE